MKKILVPIDGSPNSFRGLEYAIFLARQTHSTLTGLFVVPMEKPKPNDQISSLEKFFLDDAASFMEKAKIKTAKKGILFYDRVVYGEEGTEIIKFAQKRFDLIVIGSRGRGIVKESFLGSTSNYVLHKSKTPILIVK